MMTRRKYVKEKPDARRLGSQKTLHLFGEHLRHIHSDPGEFHDLESSKGITARLYKDLFYESFYLLLMKKKVVLHVRYARCSGVLS